MNDFEIQQVRIAEIRIGDRHRRDLGGPASPRRHSRS